uniref:Uncharacterized protein n=1 Tax=Aotus nancymaae TaxID=37293 RepID=A0A2K5ETV2_AOTNA
MVKSGDKSSGGKKSLERKAAAEELQEAAFAGDGATESEGQPPKAAAFPPGFSVSIKNEQRRHLIKFTRWKRQQQQKEKLAAKKKLNKEREALGDEAPPKPVPKTIDNQRVCDETTVDPNDEEVAYDEITNWSCWQPSCAHVEPEDEARWEESRTEG